MKTEIAPHLLLESGVKISEEILRTCVHCGFCNATCPTYLLSGNELEGPRGRIYLIKSILEEAIDITSSTVSHIDHCLGCMACETTCPSGVRYSHLLEEARPRLEKNFRRSPGDLLLRKVLTYLLPHPSLLRPVLRMSSIGRSLKFLLPARWRNLLELAPSAMPAPARVARPGVIQAQGEKRARVAFLTGCAQQVLGPHINDASVRTLTRLGAEVVVPPALGCCGSLPYHMGERRHSLKLMRRAVLALSEELETGGLDAIAVSTSGCGPAMREYGHIFRDEPEMAEKAASVAALVKDISEVISDLGLGETRRELGLRVAYHDACSLQHAQRVRSQPRELLTEVGCTVVEVPEAHICCGSAGAYSMLETEYASRLRQRKVAHIEQTEADVVAAGNIGCMEQIAQGTKLPVVHTIELLDWGTGGPVPEVLKRRGLR
jgi:glycolate oxidase iron-sulfur subunit